MKFILDNIFIVAIAAISGGALLWPALAPRGKRVSPLQATQMINRGKTLVLDVRSADEFAAGHLRDAKHVPLADLASRLGELDKSASGTCFASRRWPASRTRTRSRAAWRRGPQPACR